MNFTSFFIRLITLLNILIIPIAILMRWFFKSKVGCAFYEFYSYARSQFKKLSVFWQNFFTAFSIGIVSYVILSWASNFSIVITSQNLVFDHTLNYYTEFSNKEKSPPILISVDEESYQNISWIARSDKQSFESQDTLQLVDTAFNKGSRYVFVDFDISGGHLASHNKEVIANNVQKLIDKHKDGELPKHLFVVIPTKVDYCLPNIDYYHTFEAGIWNNIKLNQGNFFIHPVSPSFFKSSDQVVRHWNLFSVGRYSPQNNENSQQWSFIPSPQLAYHLIDSIERDYKDNYQAIEKLKQISWLSAFDKNSKHDINLLGRNQFENQIYNDLIQLSNNNHLTSFCDKNDSKNCIKPKYVNSHGDELDNIHRANTFKSLLANPNSEVCHDKIDEFVSTFEIANNRDARFENRIIYSMKSWYDADAKTSANYEVFTPIQMYDATNQRMHHAWKDRIVVIGANYIDSRDVDYATPIGSMPGTLINLNAIISFNDFGAVGLLSIYQNILLNIGIIFVASLIFARFNTVVATGINLGIFAITILLTHRWLFEHGLWIEFGLPVLVINISEAGIDILEWIKKQDNPKENVVASDITNTEISLNNEDNTHQDIMSQESQES